MIQSTARRQLDQEDFALMRVGRFRLRADPRLPREWIERVISDAPRGPARHHITADLPDEGQAWIKFYNRRAGHGLRRRLKSGRSIREAAGYLEFARRGLDTPRLLMWGERRALGLWDQGVIVTERVDAPTVAERYQQDGAWQILEATAESLAAIHGADLAHGDPRTRNFLAGEGDVIPFDLCSWRPLTLRSRRDDLVCFLGSAISLTGGVRGMGGLLKRYAAAAGRQLAVEPRAVLDAAIVYAARERVP